MSEKLNGRRLGVLRRIHGLTQVDFGNRIGLEQARLSRMEQGSAPITLDIAHRASSIFGEPLTFFEVPEFQVLLGPAAYRRKSTARAPEKTRISELYREASRIFAISSELSGYRTAALPEPQSHIDQIADSVRGLAGLGAAEPVRNVVRLLERLGIGVVTNLDGTNSPVSDADVSGITMPTRHNRRPLVATTQMLRGDVQRLTHAHELGHLIFDRDASAISCSSRSSQEQRAFDFGSALLLPTSVIRARIFETSTLSHYLELKADYGLSVKAIMQRAHRLGIISSDRFRTLSIQHSSRGWRRAEPVEVSLESPLLLKQALHKVFPRSTFARASQEFGLAPTRLRRWANVDSDGGLEGVVTSLQTN